MGNTLKLLVFVNLAFASTNANSEKISLELLNSFDPSKTIVVEVKSGVSDVLNKFQSQTLQFETRSHKISSLRSVLLSNAEISQKLILEKIGQINFTAKASSVWISNEIFLKNATPELIKELSQLEQVSSIREQIILQLPETNLVQKEITQKQTLQWGVARTKVKPLWDANYTGQGVIVGHIDSGVRHTHAILRDNWLGNVSPHGWFDPENKSPTPYDSGHHGTHTLGSAVGSNGYGIAPGALWTSCIACYADGCTEFALKMCGEFMLCPTDPQGGNKESCSKAPNLVTNSWGGGAASTFYDNVIDAWRLADIIPIFAAGNEGPECRSVSSPGDNKDVITVGAIQQGPNDPLARFSSVGPQIKYLNQNIYKPDIVAPGTEILSSIASGDNNFGIMQGTSMATPFVSGSVAVLLSHHHGLKFSRVLASLQKGADNDQLDDNRNCGGVNTRTKPNHMYGHGVLNIQTSDLLLTNGEIIEDEPNSDEPASSTNRNVAYYPGILFLMYCFKLILCK